MAETEKTVAQKLVASVEALAAKHTLIVRLRALVRDIERCAAEKPEDTDDLIEIAAGLGAMVVFAHHAAGFSREEAILALVNAHDYFDEEMKRQDKRHVNDPTVS